MDGKWLRGAPAHSERICLLGLADATGGALLQAAVAPGATELATAQHLLTGRKLTGQLVTADAAFTDPVFARQIRARGGDYLFVVKANQPALLWAVCAEFTKPHYLVDERAQVSEVVQAESAGHGRLERRTLEASTRLGDYLAEDGWPDVARVLCRTCRRIVFKTGEVTTTRTYAITSLDRTTRLNQVAASWRGHWGSENRGHHVRDVSFQEDAGQAHTGAIPQALAALRNGLLCCIRAAGWTTIANAVRHYAAAVTHALMLIGADSLQR